MTTNQTPRSDKLGWAALISSVLIPVVAGVVAGIYATRVKDSENDMKYIELAVSIIREEPKQETAALRDWSVAVIAARSIVPLSKEAQEELRTHRVPLAYTYDQNYDPQMPVDFTQFGTARFTGNVPQSRDSVLSQPPASAGK